MACRYKQGARFSEVAQPGMGFFTPDSSSSDSLSLFSRYGEIWYEKSEGAPCNKDGAG